MALDRLAKQWRTDFTTQPKWEALAAKHGRYHLLKPQTFMNESGLAVSVCCQFFKIPPEQVLAVYDEVALPLGKMRLRPGGSAGGHNGMKSLIQHLGTDKFPRLRLGIGGAERQNLTGHVLGRFSAPERETLDKSLDRAVEAVIFATLNGWAAAMNAFNTKESKPQQQAEAAPAATPPDSGKSLSQDKPKQPSES